MTDKNLIQRLWPFSRGGVIEHREEVERKDNPENMQQDKAFAGTSIMQTYQGKFESYNPDMLVKMKGAEVYHKMLRDDQVKAVFNVKLNSIVSRPWRFEVRDEGQKECAKFFERNITDLLCGTWQSALRGILMGKAYGFSVTEKVFRSWEVDGSPRWILWKLKSKPFNSFQFVEDQFGNLLDLKQEMDYTNKKLDLDKFIIYVNHPEINPIWGESELKAAYRPYWEKDITQKFWNIYLERMAGGFLIATPNEKLGAISTPDINQFEQVLQNASRSAGIRVPKGYDLTVEVPDGTDAFQMSTQECNKRIARAILVPNLLGFSEQGSTGSYAQSKSQMEMFMMLIEEDVEYLADILNEQLFAQLAWWNFGLVDYPRIKFDPLTTTQKREMAEAWVKANKDAAVTNTDEDELRTRELLQYPKLDVEEMDRGEDEAAKGEEPEDKPDPDNDAKPDEDDADTPDEVTPDAKDENKEWAVFSSPEWKGMMERIGDQLFGRVTDYIDSKIEAKVDSQSSVRPVDGFLAQHVDKDEPAEEDRPQFTDRVDFEEASKKLDEIDGFFYKGLSESVDKTIRQIQDGMKKFFRDNPSVRKTKKAETEKIVKWLSESVTSDTKKEMHAIIRNSLRLTYDYGRRLSKEAIARSLEGAPVDIEKRVKGRMALMTEHKACLSADWNFVNFLEGLSLDTAEEWFKDRAFTITGELNADMMDAAINVMTQGIINEQSVGQMVAALAEVLPTLVGTTDKAERARLETIVRTNMSTIFTQAQLAFYNHPDLAGFVEGYEYSAVMDRRTTAICQRLDGSKYATDNPIWQHITPPNHFNCRSTLIPVTVLDKWRASTRKFGEKQQPDKGFGQAGFLDKWGKK